MDDSKEPFWIGQSLEKKHMSSNAKCMKETNCILLLVSDTIA